MTAFEIHDLVIPASPDSDDDAGRRFREFVAIKTAVLRERWGHDDHSVTPREAWGTYASQSDDRIVPIVAFDGDTMVGRATVNLPIVEATHTAMPEIMVLSAHRRRGVGTALAAAIERMLADEGRTTVQVWSEHLEASGARRASPTGFGSIPASSPEVAFLDRHGFVLEQVERISELRVADATYDALLTDARAASTGYRLVTWAGRTPTDLRDGLAQLHARMSTDVPAAGLDIDEEIWDAARLDRYEAREDARGRTLLRAVALHRESGEVVAFTTLVLPADEQRAAHQEDTLVHAEHRGHRLGMLVKLGNLEQLASLRPDTKVITWNAEENRPMLDVNESMGFVAIGYEGAWQRVAG